MQLWVSCSRSRLFAWLRARRSRPNAPARHCALSEYRIKLVPIINEVVVNGSTAYDYGCHEITLTPKAGGQPIRKRVRYLDHWQKNAAGQWKISFFMSNEDVKEVSLAVQ
jgi:hypothetical protein